jgi:probable rRNA maturation factor
MPRPRRIRQAAPDIEITVQSSLWRKAVPDIRSRARRAALAALTKAGRLDPQTSVSLLFADDESVRPLNFAYRKKDMPTNVLSFPAPDTLPPAGIKRSLGDVILAVETVTAEAIRDNKPIGDHLSHLIVHGVLHLIGFDHETSADADIMEPMETQILAGLGIPDPYRELAL